MVDQGAAVTAVRDEQLLLRHQHPRASRGKYLLNSGGRPKLFEISAEVVADDYQAVRADDARLTVRPSRSGVSGRAHDAGQPQRRRGEQEAAAVVLAQPGRELVQVPHLAERDAELEQAEVVDRAGTSAGSGRGPCRAVPRPRSCRRRAPRSASRRSTRAATRRARRGSVHIVWIFTGSGLRFHSRTLVAKPVCSSSMSPGSTTTSSAAMISSSVCEVDAAPVVAEVVREVDEHAAALHAVERHVLEAEVVREAAVAAAVARGVVAAGRRGRRRRGSRCSRRPPRPRRRRRRTRRPTCASESHCVEYCSESVTTSSAHTSTYVGSPHSGISLMWTL